MEKGLNQPVGHTFPDISRPHQTHTKIPSPQSTYLRASLPFREVNRRDTPGHDAGFQRHHLLPRQLLSQRCFGPMLDEIGSKRIGFDDFRHNGLLLPARDDAARRIGLPLHRGPHRAYNAMVIERVGQVEASWSALRQRAPEIATFEAVERLRLLQRALRRRLLEPGRKPFALNRHDPLGKGTDFTALDAMVDALWEHTDPVMPSQPDLPKPLFADSRSWLLADGPSAERTYGIYLADTAANAPSAC